MPVVVGVRFKRADKIKYFNAAGYEALEAGDWIIVETSRGKEAARVIIPPQDVPEAQLSSSPKPILKIAEPGDLLQMQRLRSREAEVLEKCRSIVAEAGLAMKVVKAEYSFDGSRLTFYFTAEKRIDFRHLVRDLAKSLRTKIEMRQIGVRDQAKISGGIGPCGMTLCCSSWLTDFSPVSINMAKTQDLPLSPMEVSGLCGRLRCCLAFENEYYRQVKEALPRLKEKVTTAYGPGHITAVNVLKETVSVKLENEITIEVPISEL
ncbi:MAG: stage 0 sporulation family protein, partial [Anaerolineae bacterium]